MSIHDFSNQVIAQATACDDHATNLHQAMQAHDDLRAAFNGGFNPEEDSGTRTTMLEFEAHRAGTTCANLGQLVMGYVVTDEFEGGLKHGMRHGLRDDLPCGTDLLEATGGDLENDNPDAEVLAWRHGYRIGHAWAAHHGTADLD